MKQGKNRLILLLPMLMALCAAGPPVLHAQADSQLSSEESTISGTVVSSSRNTMVVRTQDNRYQLFVYGRGADRPSNITVGSRVRVVSTPGDQGMRIASNIRVTEAAAAGTGAAGRTGAQTQQDMDPLPEPVRQLERDIERQVRRYQLGVRTGVALDPELFLVGVHARMGPIFNRDVYFRPNVELAFGEVTTMFAVNLEAVARLPITARGARWSAYAGAGPAFQFSHQNFERQTSGPDIDFGDFDFQAGFNVLGGVEFRNGMFAEMKSTVYAAPHLRFILGYSF